MNEHIDTATAVGHTMALSAIAASWLGLLAPLAAFVASCMSIAWFATQFYDRRKKRLNG